jgi:hypothetical protein
MSNVRAVHIIARFVKLFVEHRISNFKHVRERSFELPCNDALAWKRGCSAAKTERPTEKPGQSLKRIDA